MLTVVAALIESGGKLLVCQRRRGTTFELLWEFPGGKVKLGEELREALARELREELDVSAVVGPELYRTQHKYPAMSEAVELIFFGATVEPRKIRNRVFEKIEWRRPALLSELNFLPADRELIEQLASGQLRLPSSNMPGTAD
jgi:8-oxo-dGTP diphosphatase